jgi:hypothetical protein
VNCCTKTRETDLIRARENISQEISQEIINANARKSREERDAKVRYL